VPPDTAMNVKPSSASSPQEAFSPDVYWENRLSQNFSLGGVGHGLLGYQYNRWAYRLRDRVLRRHLAPLRLRLSDSSILDVGSGTGFYIDFWRNMGAGSISGSDLS
jgi:2-polyprenyl-3-methyl-5-hydroxy-6-metoxy-1,4-benzoquinol methylase